MKHTYLYASGKLLRETYGDTTIDFFYDASGNAYALKYNGTTYYYITNLQGDVMSIVDEQGTVVASYEYDPYGNVTSSDDDLAEINPLRYRGYYYDGETGMYYLQSRYYDPEIGRFINADVFASTGQGLPGYNMFAYCGNQPVSRGDATGFGWHDFWEGIKDWLNEKKDEASSNEDGTATIGLTVSGAFGVGGSLSCGITFDAKGNIGIAATGNAGGGLPSAGVGGYVNITNAPDIYKQQGLGTVVGASGGPGVVAVGAEYCLLVDSAGGNVYHGVTVSATAGLYPTVVEMHGEVGYTSVIGFNVFDALICVVDVMLQE